MMLTVLAKLFGMLCLVILVAMSVLLLLFPYRNDRD